MPNPCRHHALPQALAVRSKDLVVPDHRDDPACCKNPVEARQMLYQGRVTFDSIICNAVLEHVHSPETVVAEMIRVLRPGGILYAEVPFIFFVHGHPNDFRRYTQEGMRRLFGGLDGLELGITNGPVSATLQTVNTLLQILVPTRMPLLLKALRGVFGWTVFPLKYLDRRLSRRSDAHILAGGFYAIGRKPGVAG